MLTVNRDVKKWIRPWDGQPDGIYERDDRFFSILVKGALAYLTNNIIMYGKPIRHFIFNTGSSYMYVETNGYKYSVTEVTDQDQIYMERPRCVANIGTIGIDTQELTQPYVRGVYERFDNGEIKGFNAEIKRLPIQMQLNLQYVLSTFNESITLLQELLDKLCFQKYFSIVYLGQVIKCSIEFPSDLQIELNKIDMSSSDTNNRTINITVNICTSYPSIDEETEQPNSAIIAKFRYNTDVFYDSTYPPTYDPESVKIE